MQHHENLQGDRRAGPSLTAFNYESRWGQLALKATYKAIMEEEGLPVMPPCCRPNMNGQAPMTLQQFLGQVAQPVPCHTVDLYQSSYTQPACVQWSQAWPEQLHTASLRTVVSSMASS